MLIIFCTVGLALYLFLIIWIISTYETVNFECIKNVSLASAVYGILPASTIYSIIATRKILKNKTLSLFNKISLFGFVLVVIFTIWYEYNVYK